MWPGEFFFHTAKINITITSKNDIDLLASLATFLAGVNKTTSKMEDYTGTTLHTMLYNSPSVSRTVKSFVYYENITLLAECSNNYGGRR
jgi:hypothetical protein